MQLFTNVDANKKNEDAMKAEFMGENPPKDNKFIKNQKS